MATRSFSARAAGPGAGALFAPATATRRFYHGLDALRGLAALAVVLRHYQLFFLPAPDTLASPAVLAAQPLFGLLGPVYSHGQWAVQFFWILSGFVFAAVYAGTDPGPRFFRSRFARLYPLHFLTLLVVAGLQALSVRLTGGPQFMANNDAWHFVLNLFMATGWAGDGTMSFNGPIWSVSVEILIYVLFWMVLPWLFRAGLAGPLVFALLFRVALTQSNSMILVCGLLFFAGSAIYVLHRAKPVGTQLALAAMMLGAAGLLIAFNAGRGLFMGICLGFAGLILFAAALEPRLARPLAPVRWLGDASYGIYLWHIPLQITLMLLLPDPVATMRQPLALLLYLAAVIAIACVSFTVFERPARRWINGRTPAPRTA